MISYALPLAQYQSKQAEVIAAVTRVFNSGNYILGPEVASFERAFAAYLRGEVCSRESQSSIGARR